MTPGKARIWCERVEVTSWSEVRRRYISAWRYLVPLPDGEVVAGGASDWATAMKRVAALREGWL